MKRDLIYSLLCILFICFTACEDEPLGEDDDFTPGAKSTVTAIVEFKPLVPALNGASRTAGNAIKEINDLWVLLYSEDGNLVEMKKIESLQPIAVNREDLKPGEPYAESETSRVSFKLVVPQGRYYVYAVANLDLDLPKYEESIQTREGLKGISFDWDAGEIANNSQMFGHFSADEKVLAEEESVLINRNTAKLHAWVRRAASKVTVAYDASGLKEGVFVYLKSVQIRDIPATCFLRNENTVEAEENLIKEGEIIRYYEGEDVPAFDEKYPVRLATGKPNHGEHGEASNALFFYENMQGAGEKMPSKLQDANKDGELDYPGFPGDETYRLKDDVPYGTYIEVDAYYVSVNSEKVGRGPIKYRFMLGKDVDRDYNAERNYHYKLTLKFNGFANDADWHIEYKEKKPGIEVPNPYYISYLYNHSMMFPLKINAGDQEVESVEAKIIDNRWAPNNPNSDFLYWKAMDLEGENPWNGFLSLHKTTETVITHDGPWNPEVNKGYYETPPKRGERSYENMKDGSHTTTGAEDDDEYTVRFEKSDDGNIYHVSLPMYTRAKQLVKQTAYTGNNPYVAYQRKAVVRIKAKLNNGDILEKDATIYQVRRVVNPKGIWRKWDNDNSFHVVLKRLPRENATRFETFSSEGPWKAYVVEATEDFITFTGGNKVEGNVVHGLTGSDIDFKINFNGKCANENVSRHAIIRVEYHNYTCYHLIFVRQGYAPDDLIAGGTKWHTCNMKTGTEETDSPVEEGSLFKFGNWTQPIDALSNKNPKTDWVNIVPSSFQNDINKDFMIAGTTGSSKWSGISFNETNSSNSFSKPAGKNWKVASYEDYKKLYSDENIEQGFGILYGDDAATTADNINDAYGYDYEHQEGRGMRGCFVYNKKTGKNLFFPIGASGYGHRKDTEGNGFNAVLRYASTRHEYFPSGWLSDNYPHGVGDAPLFYDLFMRPGAVYWLDKRVDGVNVKTNTELYIDGAEANAVGWDFNYFTFDFFPISSNSVKNGKDACFVRCVE